MKLYISGPITGVPDYKEKFSQAAGYLGHLGDEVEIIDPSTFAGEDGWNWADWMLIDLRALRGADALVSLPGSMASRGARVEAEFARGMGIPVLDLCDVRAWIAKGGRG
jgi:hypothetical protein